MAVSSSISGRICGDDNLAVDYYIEEQHAIYL
jgi:hypothetical protein